MKATIKLYDNDGRSDKGFPVKLILSQGTKTRRRTISHSEPYDWDKEMNFPRNSHPDSDALFEKISQIRKESLKMSFSEITDFDHAFDVLLNQHTLSQSFYDWGDKRVADLEQQGKAGNSIVYTTALNALKKHYPYLTFKQLNHDVLANFREECKKEGKANSTIHNYLRTLRAIYNSAPRALRNVEYPFDTVFKKVHVKKRRANNRYFSKEQIKWMESLDLPQKSYQRAIDLSLLQFYLCGVDMYDIYYLKETNIANGRVFLKRGKLGDKGEEFDVLLSDKAKAIIDKYRESDNGYVFPWRKSEVAYKTFRKNHNRSLKIIKEKLEIELMPRDDKWTTKVMRHTFATLGKFAHIEEDLLRELMGHERNDIDTVYKDRYPEKDRDAAQLLVIE